ncbi:DNA-binding GntR family transcriptional regulator [Streptacidiphilus sp. MAP12-33]|uniref:winged helix-turn-helix domain-containing protein n=1 Tax=Streptacidiphilus sp. MAP12-33 TaxID=3156266 RepID=UPI0035152A08
MAQFSGRAAYLQIADEIKVQIRNGGLEPGAKLPSESEIMQLHDVSRTVARQAISRLREDGYAYSHQGKGSFAALPDAANAAKHSPEYEQINETLLTVLGEVRRLAERLDELEAVVRSEPLPK